eukprot:202960_1
MELCAGDPGEVGLDKLAQSGLSVAITGLDKGGLYLNTDAISLSSNYDWNTTSITDSIREYNIIYDDFDIYSVSVVFINNNQKDAICIDKVIINDQKAILTSFWIGSASDNTMNPPVIGCDNNRPCLPAIPAVLSWPICKTEIIDQRISLIDRINEDGETLSSTCRNENRFYSVNCAASKSYAYSYSASWESATSSSDSRGIEIAQGYEAGSSWEIGSSVTLGGEAKVGAEVDVKGVGKATTEATTKWEGSFSSTFGASASFSRSRTSSRETTFERSFSKTTDKTTETTISCEASVEVGPFEELNYDVIKAVARSKFQTFTDFKFTKCSYILDPDDTNPNHFVYLMNIPGDLDFTETTSCSITFYEPKYIQAGQLTCREAQKIKGINELSTYVPFCNPDNTEQWDSCQCEIGDKWTDQTCFCVDPSTGLATDAFKSAVVDTAITTWKNWCYQNCPETQFTPDQPLVDMNGNRLPTNPTTTAPTPPTIASLSPTLSPTLAPITKK